TLRFPSAIVMNLGEIPKATYPNKYPNTRMGVAGLIRTALTQAQENVRKRDSAKEEEKRPARNTKVEALEPALKGEIPVLLAAHRANDIETALRIAREYHLKPVLTLATEGYLVADSIATAKAPVVVHPTMQRVGSLETYNTYLGNAAALATRGIPV